MFCPFPQYVSEDLFSLGGKKSPTVLIIVILDITSVDDNKTVRLRNCPLEFYTVAFQLGKQFEIYVHFGKAF